MEQFDIGVNPRGIILYGATDRPGAWANSLTNSVAKMAGRGRRILFVNPSTREIAGLRSVPAAAGIAGPWDLALVAVPPDLAPWALEDCVAAGISLAVMYTAGLGESGPYGQELEARVLDVVRTSGCRLIGPNCLGLMDVTNDVVACGTSGDIPTGNVSVIGQSGSVALRLMEGIVRAGSGIDLWVSAGNCSDVTVAELLAYLTDRPTTSTIVLYLEDIGDPDAFRQGLTAARDSNKPVIVLKSGRSERGIEAAASHTGASASPDIFVEVMLREFGAFRAQSIQQACDLTAIVGFASAAKGNAAVVCPSGGDCTLAADACEKLDITLAEISEPGMSAMKELIPLCAPQNPIDPTPAVVTRDLLVEFLNLVIGEEDVDYLVYLVGAALRTDSAPAMMTAFTHVSKTGLPLIVAGPAPTAIQTELRKLGIGYIDDSERVFDVLSALRYDIYRNSRYVMGGSTGGRRRDKLKVRPSGEVSHMPMNEVDALRLLDDLGFPMVKTTIVHNETSLEAYLNDQGYPLILKAIVPGITHKSQLGLVSSEIYTRETAVEAFIALGRTLARFGGKHLEHSRIIAQPVVRDIVGELVVSGVVDRSFGPHVMVGMGGILTDAFEESRVWFRAPLDAADVKRRLMASAAVASCIDAVGGADGGVTDEVVDICLKVGDVLVASGNLTADAHISELELNPVIVTRNGLVGVDAVISRPL